MAFAKIPEGYVHPGYVVVTLFTGKAEPVVNVYGTYATRAEAHRERRQMIRDEIAQRGEDALRHLSLFVRPIHDIPQLNRLLEEQEAKA